ncbi:MAG TPA: AEC family transporter, partial [Burkholderiaceae bacterium]|nr:AEC family transporter [Burkholderiaceae bacterium]
TLDDLNQPGFVVAFIVATAAVFLTSCIVDRHRKRRLADVSLEGLAASYANAGFMGIPLVLILFGEAALPPAIIITLLTACGLFAFSIVLIELDLQASPNPLRTLCKVGRSLLRNPLVVAPILGFILAAGEIELPWAVLQFTTLLGNAASPCALITIGLFLAQSQPSSQAGPVWRIVALKLILHPALTAILVYLVFDMPRLWADTAVLLSALPVGTGPFMLATLYQRDASISSRAILISTVLSILTVSLLVILI